MSAIYDGLEFKTPLHARWAAFFDLSGWKWNINPVPVGDWLPDFRVTFPCGHSECNGSHTLLVTVLPLSRIEDFTGHPCLSFPYGHGLGRADAGAAFGTSPKTTTWEMAHGAGGGMESIDSWVNDSYALWTKAKELVPG